VKKISRFDLADFASPERIVDGIIRLIPDLPIPVPVEELAQKLDILSVEEMEPEGFEGGLLLADIEKSEGIILVNRASMPQRRRFTVGHELGHFLCPFHKPQSGDEFRCSAQDMQLSFARKEDPVACMEVEANRFAALLLMPLTHFRRDLRLRKGVEIEHILTLAKRYVTSKEATARRYVDVQDEPCAVVVSHNGCVLRFYRHENFPYVDVNHGDPVPRGSLTCRTDLTPGVPSDQEECDGAIWLSVRRGRRTPTIYQQVLPQSDGYRLTLLSLAEDPEDLEEEENLEESWTPRFRR
jgi:Zn-dependent peptidase ImmA (M78 family)